MDKVWILFLISTTVKSNWIRKGKWTIQHISLSAIQCIFCIFTTIQSILHETNNKTTPTCSTVPNELLCYCHKSKDIQGLTSPDFFYLPQATRLVFDISDKNKTIILEEIKPWSDKMSSQTKNIHTKIHICPEQNVQPIKISMLSQWGKLTLTHSPMRVHWPAQVEFCLKHIWDVCFWASAPKIYFPTLLSLVAWLMNLSIFQIRPNRKCIWPGQLGRGYMKPWYLKQ